MDAVSVIAAKGWVSGTTGVASGPDMTGSLIFATDLGATLTYASSSLSLPSGSIRLAVSSDNQFMRVLDWDVTFECTGTTLTSFAGTTGNETLRQPSNFAIQKYGHSTQSGTFDFGFVTQLMTSSLGVLVGTGHMIGAVPGDEAHSTSPALTWTLVAHVRRTDRPT
jgi:hypothetical protein